MILLLMIFIVMAWIMSTRTSSERSKQKWRHDLLGNSVKKCPPEKNVDFCVSEKAFPCEIPTYMTHWSYQLKIYSCIFLLYEISTSGYFILSNAARSYNCYDKLWKWSKIYATNVEPWQNNVLELNMDGKVKLEENFYFLVGTTT